MTKYFRLSFLLLIVLSTFGLVGCGDTLPIIKTKYVVVKPSDELVRDCDINAVAPDKGDYLKASPQDKEAMLTQYALSLQNDLITCGIRWPALRSWYVEQLKVYSTEPTDTKEKK